MAQKLMGRNKSELEFEMMQPNADIAEVVSSFTLREIANYFGPEYSEELVHAEMKRLEEVAKTMDGGGMVVCAATSLVFGIMCATIEKAKQDYAQLKRQGKPA